LDETGRAAGLAPRSRVHKEGLWHRAVHVFLFRSDGRLIIQRRQASKDVWPGAWDLSAAEHLRPGESYAQGALRGLREELGVETVALEPWGGISKAQLVVVEAGIMDNELQQSFRGTYDGPIVPNPEEVSAVDSIRPEDLAAAFAERPTDFTPWFRNGAADLGLCPRVPI
jgi:isopentenyl-diphosphate delta-isomerase